MRQRVADLERATQLQVLAQRLEALIAFADNEEDHVLAATLEDARIQFADRYLQNNI